MRSNSKGWLEFGFICRLTLTKEKGLGASGWRRQVREGDQEMYGKQGLYSKARYRD